MILNDINGGFYSISSIVSFADDTIIIESFNSDFGIGYNIDYKKLDVTIRQYKGSMLNAKPLCTWTDSEIVVFAEELLKQYLSRCSLVQITEWVTLQKHIYFEGGCQVTKEAIQKVLGIK